jgi:peptidoglycan/xylan/chitin deacetylase (PgdA/CDA1 family)
MDRSALEGTPKMFGARAQDTKGLSLPIKVRDMAGRFLARAARRKTLPLREGPAIVSFTFDDVPSSACETGARILERHGVRGTFYVAGGGCGAPSPVGTLASAEQIRKIWKSGHEIGCHTYSHPNVSRISLDELGNELDRNREFLRTIDSAIVPRDFAYPYGEMSIRSKRRLEGSFDSCRSVHPGINNRVADLGSLKAWPLESAAVDRAKIASLIAETVQKNGWLIFYSHDVSDKPSTYGVTPDLLEWAVISAKKAGCIVATVAGGLDLLGGAAGVRRRVLSLKKSA